MHRRDALNAAEFAALAALLPEEPPLAQASLDGVAKARKSKNDDLGKH